MLVLEDGDLNQVCFQETSAIFVQRNYVPAVRVVKLNLLDFLKFMKAIIDLDRYFLRRVRFICPEVQEDREFNQLFPPQKLNVDLVRLLSITLPERACQVVA